LEISEGEGLTILEFEGCGGLSILEFLNARGVKMFLPPVGGYGYFLESPNGEPSHWPQNESESWSPSFK